MRMYVHVSVYVVVVKLIIPAYVYFFGWAGLLLMYNMLHLKCLFKVTMPREIEGLSGCFFLF